VRRRTEEEGVQLAGTRALGSRQTPCEHEGTTEGGGTRPWSVQTSRTTLLPPTVRSIHVLLENRRYCLSSTFRLNISSRCGRQGPVHHPSIHRLLLLREILPS
jgi:hypothetical protein